MTIIDAMKTKQIWKYPLDVTDVQKVMMPKGAMILSAQVQRDILCLWALGDPEQPKEARFIEVIGTGNPTTVQDRVFIGTADMGNGSLVWHVFERL